MPDNSKVCDDSGRIRCGGCGRLFFPDGSRKKFCDHECYANSLRVPIEQRFWNRVNKNSPPPAHLPHLGACWLFTGKARLREYGSVAGVLNGKRRPLYAHRVAWELTHGPVPDGLIVCHHCDTPLCCNPAHLFVGTTADNIHDAQRKGRLPSVIFHPSASKSADGDTAVSATSGSARTSSSMRSVKVGQVSKQGNSDAESFA